MEAVRQPSPQRRAGTQSIADSPIGVLTSFFYFKNFDYSTLAPVPLILDSGAFSAYTLGKTINLGDYAKWAASLAGRYRFALNLDVLGDEHQSLINWRKLCDAGVNTAPVIHYGARADKALPPYLAAGADVITLGGIAVSGAGRQVQAWAAHVLAYLRDHAPHVRTHGLGVHSSSPLARLPFTTIDSSSPLGAFRFARLMLYDTTTKRWATVPLDGKTPYRYGRLLNSYGVKPTQVLKSSSANRDLLMELIAKNELRATADWRTRGERTTFVAQASGGDATSYVNRCFHIVVGSGTNNNSSANLWGEIITRISQPEHREATS